MLYRSSHHLCLQDFAISCFYWNEDMVFYFMYQTFLAARAGLLEELSRKLRNCVIYDGLMRQYGQPHKQPQKICGFSILFHVIIQPNIYNARPNMSLHSANIFLGVPVKPFFCLTSVLLVNVIPWFERYPRNTYGELFIITFFIIYYIIWSTLDVIYSRVYCQNNMAHINYYYLL